MFNEKKIAIIGFEPESIDLVDFPDLRPEKIRSAIDHAVQQLRQSNAEVSTYYVRPDDLASLDGFIFDIKTLPFDCILIGAGMRVPKPYIPIFEYLMTAIVRSNTKAEIAFNSDPEDTYNAITRSLLKNHKV